jgi:hypothetical protein
MPDIFHYAGEANPNDIRLADPTVVRSAGGSTKDGAAPIASVSAWAAAAGAVRPGAAVIASVSTWSASSGAVRPGAADMASVSTWTASGELVGSGSIMDGAADLLISSEWSATGAKVHTAAAGGGGGWSGRKMSRPVTLRRGKVKSAYAELRISSQLTASADIAPKVLPIIPRPLAKAPARRVAIVGQRWNASATMHGSRLRTGAAAFPIRGVGMSIEEAALILSLIE